MCVHQCVCDYRELTIWETLTKQLPKNLLISAFIFLLDMHPVFKVGKMRLAFSLEICVKWMFVFINMK